MGFSRKLAYSFGAVGTALSYQAFSMWIPFFYVDVCKLAVPYAMIAYAVFWIWNALNDPLAGFISDHTRSPWGRRIPYILCGAIPFGAIYFLLWNPPFVAGSQMFSLFLYFMLFICLFDGFYTFVVLNWASLYPEMFPSLHERAEVNSYRQSFGMIGLIIGIALTPAISEWIGWQWMGLLFGLIISFAFLTSLSGSFEKKEFSLDESLKIRDALRATLRNRSFLSYVFANLFVQYAFLLVMATVPFFAKYVLSVSEIEKTYILIMIFVTAIPTFFIWRQLTVKFGAKSCFMASMLLFAVFLLPFFVVKGFISCLFVSAALGIGFSGIILIADVLVSDIIDEDEIKTGTRREGMYFGVKAFFERFSIALMGPSLFLMQMFTGYNQLTGVQPQSFLIGLRFLLAGFSTVALLIGFAIMFMYPLYGEKLNEIKIKLEVLHLEKAKKVE